MQAGYYLDQLTFAIRYKRRSPNYYGIQDFKFSNNLSFGNTENTVYPTLLWDKQNIILVDCGFIGSLPNLEKELQRHGLSADQITGLVLTHHDHEHMGAAAALKRVNPHVKIYASAVEAPFISAQEKPLRLRQAEEMQKKLQPEQQDFGKAFCDMLRRVEPVLSKGKVII